MEENKRPQGAGGNTVATIRQSERVIQAARVMYQKDIGSLMVLDERSAIVGIITERDILRWVGTGTPESFAAAVRDVMSPHVISAPSDVSIDEAQRLMACHGIRHLPLVDGGVPVGMLSSRDILMRRQPAPVR